MGMSVEVKASLYKRAMKRRKEKFYKLAEMFGYRSVSRADLVSGAELFMIDFNHVMSLVRNRTTGHERFIERIILAKDPIRPAEAEPEDQFVYFYAPDSEVPTYEGDIILPQFILSRDKEEGEGYSLESELRILAKI